MPQGFRLSNRFAYVPVHGSSPLAGRLSIGDGRSALAAAGYDLPATVVDSGAGAVSLQFDRGVMGEELAQLVALHISGGMLCAAPGASVPSTSTLSTPEADGIALLDESTVSRLSLATDSDRKAIAEGHALELRDDDELFVFDRFVANDAVSRPGTLRITTRGLKKLAADYAAGRSILRHHVEEDIVGRSFSARVVKRTREGVSANWIHLRGYMHARASNQDLRDDIRLGIYAYDSVGFIGGRMKFVEPEGSGMGHVEVDHDNKDPLPFALLGIESSLVYLGHLTGAGNAKLAQPRPEPDVIAGPKTEPPEDDVEDVVSFGGILS